MFPELPPTVELESQVQAFWKKERIFEKCLEQSTGRPQYTFYEGPPTANGTPHNGHVLTRVIKDLIPRYQTMRGNHVPRKAGWDTHGLPVEVEVQKTLGLAGLAEIHAYGLERFSRACLDSVFSYVNEWERLTDQIGMWIDLGEAYATFHRTYVESVWWALSELFRKGLLYKGLKVVWWWPQGQTALSAGEVGLGYKTVEDPSITVAFKVKELPGHYFAAWTTTPWTLPSNIALAVKPKARYAFMPVGDEVLIVAEELSGFIKGEPTKVVLGEELVGLHYEPLYTWGQPEDGESYVVIGADFVTLDTGTGIVHIAPAFGEDDHAAAKEHGLGFLCLVGPDGKFLPGTDFVAGRFCKDCDKDIIRDLKRRSLLLKADKVEHEYPFCWRSEKDPLIQYARPAWFIRTTALNKEVLQNNAAVNWLPEHIRDGRFGDFLRNNVDWALSRERFWGTPLPIWICEKCEHQVAISSAADIEARSPGSLHTDVDEALQLHRPWIDDVTFACEHCGGTMRRVPEVIDCWFDAGCMPFAQWGFPHQNLDTFRASFPADFISEAVDQTRGWFYALIMISTLLFDEETCAHFALKSCAYPHPYRNCIVLGHVCDPEGRKESKSKGNYVPPELVIRGMMKLNVLPDPSVKPGTLGMMKAQVQSLDLATGTKVRLSADEAGEGAMFQVVTAKVQVKETVHMHPDDLAALGIDGQLWFHAPFDPPGADAFRWLFYAASPVWTNTRLSLRAVRDGQREFLLRLKNVHQFFTIYANIAGFDPRVPPSRVAGERNLLDRWILHELTALELRVTERMDNLQIYDAARAIQDFIESLSNWYVRRSRSRFWGEGPDLQDALYTLYQVLTDLTRLIAPFVPFMAEALHRSLVVEAGVQAAPSVHMTVFPVPDAKLLEPELAEDMALVREIASLGLSARAQVGVRVRQPLAAAEVVLADPAQAERLGELVALLEDELNVREVRFTEDAERFVEFRVKPNYRALGARLGKDMKACAALLAGMKGADVRRQVLAGGLVLDLASGPVTLGSDDVVVEVQPRAGFQAAGSAVAVVALHAELNDDLVEEGLAREVVNRVQNLRKRFDLGYTDRIRLGIGGDARLLAAARRFRTYVGQETLAVEFCEPTGDVQEEQVDDLRLQLSLERVG